MAVPFDPNDPTNTQGIVFLWAQNSSVDNQDPDGNTTVEYPPIENVSTGLLIRQPWPRTWHNAALNNYGDWLRHYRDTVFGVGAVLYYDQDATGVTIPSDTDLGWGGSSRETITLGTKTNVLMIVRTS